MIFSALRRDDRGLSISAWLVLISLLSLLPMLAFSVIVVQRTLQANREVEIATLQRRTSLAAEDIGRELEHARTTARILSITGAAIRGDFDGLHALAQRVVAGDPTIQLIALVRRDGQRVFSTSRPHGTAGATQPLSGNEARAIDDNVVLLSGIIPAGREGQLVVAILQPLQVEGGERLSLRLAIHQPSLSAALTSQRWPADWNAGIVDQDMHIVARSRDEPRFLGQSATEGLQAHLRSGQLAPFINVNKEGLTTLTAVARVPGSGWWVVVGLPQAELEARAREPLWWMAGVGLVLAAGGAGGALLLGRELTRQVRQAADGRAAGRTTVTELKRVEAFARRSKEALHDARHDALTGLPTRAQFLLQAEALGATARSRGPWGLAVLFIDLDGFKQINDLLGHEAGDHLLQAVAGVLLHDTRTEDCSGRHGGDEFVVALAAPLHDLQAVCDQVAARIVRDIAALGDGVGCSVGVALGAAGDDLKALVNRADQAMLVAKRAGKNRVERAPAASA